MLLTLLLYIHIFFGGLAFCTAPLALIVVKGSTWHIRYGKIFSYSMYIAVFASFILSIYKHLWFLFIIGIFSAYLVATAQRFLHKKQFKAGDPVPLIDRMISAGMLVAGIIFVVWGLEELVHKNGMGVVFMLFGLVGFWSAVTDFKIFKNGYRNKRDWMIIHIGRMVGGTTAAYTAFLVQNAYHFPSIPGWIFWLLPNLIFVPISIYFTKKEQAKWKEVL